MEKIGEYTLILFENDILELKDLLEMSLNIIFFNRNLSNNNYEDAQSKIANITYVKLTSETLNKEIIDILNDIENVFKNDTQLYGQMLTLSFYKKEEKKDNPWEKWNIILVLSNKEISKKMNELIIEETNREFDKENKIREYIFKIIEKLNDKKNYMPSVNLDDKNLEKETFSHQFETKKIKTKEEYLSLFNNYMQKNQDDIIVIKIYN